MEADPETAALYQIAATLGKSVGEVLDLPAEEVRGWAAFLSKVPQNRF